MESNINFARTTLLVFLISLFLSGCAQKAKVAQDTASTDEQQIFDASYPNGGRAPKYVVPVDSQVRNKGSRIGKFSVYPKYTSVWPRIISLYRLPKIKNKRIQRELRWYVEHPDYLQRVQMRAEPYLFDIVEQIEHQNLPGEIALLPVVESAFQPHARSHARAHGIWQFIPSTGRLYGLKQNGWYDGRRDIYASTQAAIRYLQKLHREFDGDWLLALAAYNCGEGAVHNAINKNLRRGRPTNFWSLQLPRETKNYVPRLMAISQVIANARSYNISLRPIPNRPALERVQIGSQIDMAVAAELAGISIEKLYHYNPAFSQWATDPMGPHRLVMPAELSESFKTKLAELPNERRIQLKRHKVAPGESIGAIAEKYQTSAEAIHQFNRLRSKRLKAGRHLMIPVASQKLAYYNLKPYYRGSPKKSGKIYYRVRRGDNLWKIARRYSVSTKNLAKWNRMSTRTKLRIGKKLVIWRGKPGTSRRYAKSKTKGHRRYTVRRGDSLYLIARRFKVTVADLRKWNATLTGKYIKPGQRLAVSRPTT